MFVDEDIEILGILIPYTTSSKNQIKIPRRDLEYYAEGVKLKSLQAWQSRFEEETL